MPKRGILSPKYVENVALDLTATTASLKARGIRGSLLSEKGSFYWRVRVTDTEGERKTRKIPLRLAAEPSALALAESRIVELSGQIQEQGALPDQLPWDVRKVVPSGKKNTVTVAVAVKALEVDFWKGKIRTTAAERTWERLNAETDRLPQQATLTMDLLVGVGEQQKPGSRTRLEFLKVSKRLAKLLRVEGTDRLDDLKTPYEPEARDIPSDAEIQQVVEAVISDPTWGWATWALATFGCRPSECFSLRTSDDGTAQCLTIKRKVKLPTWRTALALTVCDLSEPERLVPWDVTAPAKYDSKHAKLLCDRWQGWLKRRFPGMQLYGFRHAWAIRSISKVPSTSIAAKCMGHDIAVHHREYHRWLDQADIAAVALAMQNAA